jgi:hypothetical protein
MKIPIVVSFEGEYVKIRSDGDKTYEYSEELWQTVGDACRKHDCYCVLGIAETTRPLPVIDGIDLPQIFQQAGITSDYKIAWVELNTDAFEAVQFLETVLVNRYFNVRLFSEIAAAKEWLLGDRDS